MDPISVIREAIRQVPAMRYALAVAALVAVVALIKSFAVGGREAIFGALAVIAGMVLVLFFVVLVAHAKDKSLLLPALVLVWFVVLFAVAAGIAGVIWLLPDPPGPRPGVTQPASAASSSPPASSPRFASGTTPNTSGAADEGASKVEPPHPVPPLLGDLLVVPLNASLDDAREKLPEESFYPRLRPTTLKYSQPFLGTPMRVTQQLTAAGTVGRTVVELETEQRGENSPDDQKMTGNAEYDAYCFGTRYIDFVARLEAQFGEAMTGPDLYKDLPLEGLAAHDWSICRKVSPAAPCQSYRRRTRRTMKYPVEGFDEIQFIAEDDTAKLASGRLDDTSVWSIHTSYRKCAWKVVLAPTAR